MTNRRLVWQLFPAFLLTTLLLLLVVGWLAATSTGDFYREQMAKDLEARARLLEAEVVDLVAGGDGRAIDSLCKNRGFNSRTRITVIRPDGAVLGDTDQEPANMENHAGRPEVREALSGEVGTAVRFSNTLRKDMMYVGVPLRRGEDVVGVLRTSVDVAYIGDELATVYNKFVLGGLAIAVLAAVLSLLVSRKFARPVESLRAGADRLARGELGTRLPLPGTDELGAIADTLNRMAGQLDEQLKTIREQRNQAKAVLSSMVEGVIAVDADESVITINDTAARLFEVDAEKALNRTIQEVIRNPYLHELVGSVVKGGETVRGDVPIHGAEERLLEARGTVLRDADGTCAGAVVVLDDVTRIRRLERLRREFVANVSHELKTPITSIKGSAETLAEGAVKVPGDAERFLRIISSQADRLDSLVQDLLLLAGLERHGEDAPLTTEEVALRDVLESACRACEADAAEKGVTLEVECEPGVRARLNAPLLEHAVRNLVDNAVKYSGEKGTIAVRGVLEGGEVAVRVCDRGCGIEAQHLPRLFERFYRVDEGRSRKLGGAGLGLALVKHIAQAHRGRVEVASAPGEGSVFSIHLPAS